RAILGCPGIRRFDKDTVMTTLHFWQRVPEGIEEILIDGHYFPVKTELDHRLRLADRRKLSFKIGRGHFLFGDVCGIFHYLEGLAVQIEDRVVAGLQPHLATTFADALVLTGVVLPPAEFIPE